MTADQAARTTLLVAGSALSAAVTGWLLGVGAQTVAADRNAPWIVGRASGLVAYALLVLLVATGLVLAHPARARLRRPSPLTRIRVHAALATATLVVTLLHVVVLASDSHAGVGWQGALVPMGSDYRPVPVALGALGVYAGLLAGLTAAFSGRLPARLWWPVHKVAAGTVLVVSAHAVLTGVDTPVLMWLYVGSGAALVALGCWRYAARTPTDRMRELAGAGR